MTIPKLALRSLISRRITVALTVFAIALSIALLICVEFVRMETKNSFYNTISNTDLIIGARSGPIQLLLYSVFHIGNATNNVTWESLEDVKKMKEVKWVVPISLGDSHQGYRVVGTDQTFFQHYKYGRDISLSFAQGQPFSNLFDTVIGHEVAQSLGYKINDPIIVAHGLASFSEHKDKPFKISGILNPTGTPIDKSVMVGLRAITAIHLDGNGTRNNAAPKLDNKMLQNMALTPKSVTAALIGTSSRFGVFKLQRKINEYKSEPLLAVLPGVALQELWNLVGNVETALIGISFMVVITAFMGMLTMIFSSLNERRREMAILRAVGASPKTIFTLFVSESFIVSVLGTLVGLAIAYLAIWAAIPVLKSEYGISLSLRLMTSEEIITLGLFILAGTAIGIVPGIRAYRISVADGISQQS